MTYRKKKHLKITRRTNDDDMEIIEQPLTPNEIEQISKMPSPIVPEVQSWYDYLWSFFG